MYSAEFLARKKFANRVSWWIITSGGLMPWFVGVSIKLIFTMEGKETVPIDYFAGSVITFIYSVLLTLWWSLPFIALGFITRYLLMVESRKQFTELQVFSICIFAHLSGLLGAIITFRKVFASWDALYIFLPLQAYYGAAILLGAVLSSISILMINKLFPRHSK